MTGALLRLPALRSDDPLGVLAALGIVELCRSELGVPEEELGLAWEGIGRPAQLLAPFESAEALVQALYAAAQTMAAEDRLVPVPVPNFIPPGLSDAERKQLKDEKGREPPFDPLRVTQRKAIERYRSLQNACVGHVGASRWLCALSDQLATLPDKEEVQATPLCVPRTRQRIPQLYGKTLGAVASDPDLLHAACLAWRRNRADAGITLDWRAERDAGVTTDGRSGNAAVTGAEWLALQAAPWFRLGGLRGRPQAWAWWPTGRSGRPRAFVWPVWSQPLDPWAIEVLITHPVVGKVAREQRATSETANALRRLGIIAVFRSERTTLPNSEGPLGSPTLLWPA